MGEGFVLQDWMATIPWKQQSVLLSSLRGPDQSRPGSIKIVGRWLRGVMQKNADTSTEYMATFPLPEEEEFHRDLEYCTMHFYSHLMHALEIVGYNHPDNEIAENGRKYYLLMTDFLHLNPETKEQMNKRLEDRV